VTEHVLANEDIDDLADALTIDAFAKVIRKGTRHAARIAIKLPHYRVGKSIFVPQESLRQYLRGCLHRPKAWKQQIEELEANLRRAHAQNDKLLEKIEELTIRCNSQARTLRANNKELEKLWRLYPQHAPPDL
jgi:septal ring factor EnvC (AmiA/AmiB activator)